MNFMILKRTIFSILCAAFLLTFLTSDSKAETIWMMVQTREPVGLTHYLMIPPGLQDLPNLDTGTV